MDIYEIRKAKVRYISLVKKGANNKSFFEKSKDGNDYTLNARVLKSLSSTSDNKHVLKCVVYEPDVVDLQGDWMTDESIKNYAYDFMKNYRNIDMEHDFEAGIGDVVESYIAPVDMVVNGELIKKGSHCIGIEVSDEIKKKVDDGEITGVSIAGSCERVKVEKSVESEPKNVILDAINNLGNLFKSKVADENNNNNEDGEIEMEEMKVLISELKDELTKSFKEELEKSKTESKAEFDAKIVEIEKSIEDNKVADKKLEKSDREKTEEKIAEMEKELNELRKSIELPISGTSENENTEPYSIVYKTV